MLISADIPPNPVNAQNDASLEKSTHNDPESDFLEFFKNHSLFSSASSAFLQDLVSKVHLRQYLPGDHIIKEGDIAKAMFLLVKGAVRVVSGDGESVFADLGQGQFFGGMFLAFSMNLTKAPTNNTEVGVIFDVPRTADVMAKSKCLIIVLTRDEMISIMHKYPAIEDEIRLEAHDRYSRILQNNRKPISNEIGEDKHELKLFQPDMTDFIHPFHFVPDVVLSDLNGDDIPLKVYNSGSKIYQSEQISIAEFYVIKSGKVALITASGDHVFCKLIQGCSFGESAILFMDKIRNETAIALERSEIMTITKLKFDKLVEKYPEFTNTLNLAAKRSKNWSIIQRNRSSFSLDQLAPSESKRSPSDSPDIPKILSSLTSLRKVSESSSDASEGQSTPSRAIGRSKRNSFFLVNPAPLVTSASESVYSRRQSKVLDESNDSIDNQDISMSIDALELQRSRKNSNCLSQKSDGFRSLLQIETVKNKLDTYSLDDMNDFTNNENSVEYGRKIGSDYATAPAIEEEDSNLEDTSNNSELSDIDEDEEFSKTDNLRFAELLASDPKRRRASVAVWSDSKLMEIAAQKAAPVEKRSVSPRMKEVHPEQDIAGALDFLSSGGNLSIKDDTVSQIMSLEPNLTENSRLIELVLEHLTFPEIWYCRSVCSFWNTTITTREHILSHIDLSHANKGVDDSVVSLISQHADNFLTCLIMRNCWRVTDEGLREISRSCKNLSILDLCGCWEITDDGLKTLSLGCRKIKSIDLSNCRKVTDVGVCSLISNLNNISDIFLSYCKALTDLTMVCIANNAPGIRRINLQRCLGITDNGFQALSVHNPKYKKLRELNLSDCSFLSDLAMKNISNVCVNLKVLNLSFCCALSEDIWEDLTKGCPNIAILDASFCGNSISDESIQVISYNLANSLRRLSVRGCIRVSDVGVDCLIENATNLEAVNLSNCKNISSSTLSSRIPASWKLLGAQSPVIEANGIAASEVYSSSHVRRFTA